MKMINPISKAAFTRATCYVRFFDKNESGKVVFTQRRF